MSGLLWSAVDTGRLELPPSDVRTLAARDLAVRGHHLRLWKTVGELQRRVAGLDVRIAAVKGVVAEALWYERIGERPSKDIDVLLGLGPSVALEQVIDALQPGRKSPRTAARLLSAGILQSLDMRVGEVEVDLHVDLLKFEVPTRSKDSLWIGARTVDGPEGVRTVTLGPETSLVHLLVHLNKDGFAQLVAYADIARLLNREDIDWEVVDEVLAAEGLRVSAYSTLRAVVSALDLPSPPVPRPRGWRAAVWERLWPERDRLQGPITHVVRPHRQLWLPWLAEGRVWEAFHWLIRRRVFPPRALVEVWFPETRGPYIARLVVGRLHRVRERRRTIRNIQAAS